MMSDRTDGLFLKLDVEIDATDLPALKAARSLFAGIAENASTARQLMFGHIHGGTGIDIWSGHVANYAAQVRNQLDVVIKDVQRRCP